MVLSTTSWLGIIIIIFKYHMYYFFSRSNIIILYIYPTGGKNPFLGYAYIGVGALALVLAIIFLLKQLISPRELGDTKFLVWKQK